MVVFHWNGTSRFYVWLGEFLGSTFTRYPGMVRLDSLYF